MVKRRLYSIAAWMLLCLTLCTGAAPVAAAAQGAEGIPLFTDVQFLGGPGRDAIFTATPFPDDSLLLTCTTQGGFDGHEQLTASNDLAWLLRLSPEGDILWQKTYGTLPGQNVMTYAAPQADGSFTIWNYHALNQEMEAVYVLTMNGQGEETAREEHGISWPGLAAPGESDWVLDYGTGQYLLQTPSGETLAAVPFQKSGGSTGGPVRAADGIVMADQPSNGEFNRAYGLPASSYSVIEKRTATGAIAWQTAFLPEPSQGSILLSLPMGEPTRDGGYLVAGYAYDSLESREQTYRDVASLLDADGNILWQKEHILRDSGTGYSLGFASAVEVEEGYVLLYTTQTDTTLNALLIDHQGNELSRRSFRAEQEAYLYMQLVKTGGNVWAYGLAERKESGLDIALMRLNLDALLIKE